MAGRQRRRFWKAATTAPVDGGYGVFLDGRPLMTPAKGALALPTPGLAEMVAAEWNAQHETIRPDTMPATRAANAAIDKVMPQFDEVAAIVAAYAESDLLCYRAESPAGLVARQAEAWDPLLEWSARCHGVRWVVTKGIMPCAQPAETLERMAAIVRGFGPFELTALHELVALSGSLVIGLALAGGVADAQSLWDASRIDEDWQIEQWGEDAEAAALTAARRAGFFAAADFFAACR